MQMDGYMYQVIDFKENVIYCRGKVQGKDEEKIFYICVIVVIFMMSSCEKNTQKNVKSHELDYCKTEQIQLINGMNTKYWKMKQINL